MLKCKGQVCECFPSNKCLFICPEYLESVNNSPAGSQGQFKRLPFKRILTEDLADAIWDDNEKLALTRYGKLKRIRVCGVVVNKREIIEQKPEDSIVAENNTTNSRASFNVDDGTGSIWATYWGIQKDQVAHITKGSLVDVVGLLRSYRNNFQLTVEMIRVLEDPNVELLHVASVLKTRKTQPRVHVEKSEPKIFDDFDFDTVTEKKMGQTDVIDEMEHLESVSTQERVSSVKPEPLKSVEKTTILNNQDVSEQICQYIQENDQGDGVSIQEISEKCQIDLESLKRKLDQLLQDVRIYKVQPGFYSSY